MNSFIPILCPICSSKLRNSNAMQIEHLLVCSNDDESACAFISFDEDWQFKDMSYYVGKHLLIVVHPDKIVFAQDGMTRHIDFTFTYDEMLSPKRLIDLVGTLTVFL